MKKIVMLLILMVMPIWAESLTVLNEVKNSMVFLNGVYIGSETITNHRVDAGEYILVIKKNSNTIFKKSLVIAVGENRVVDSNNFVSIEGQSK